MSGATLAAVALQNFIPGFFSMLFRIFGLGAKSRKAAICVLAVFSALSFAFPFTLIPLMGYDRYKLIAFFVTLLANSAVLIISSDTFLKTCFLHFSQANMLFWISTVIGSLRRMLAMTYLSAALLRLLLCAAALFLGLKICAKPLRFMADTIRSGWLGLIAIPGCIILAGVTIAVCFGAQPSYPELLLIAAVSLLELGFGFYMWGLYHSLRESQQSAYEKRQLALLQSEIASYNDAIAAAKQSRHDLRHHNAVLLEYLQEGETEKAIEYLNINNEALANTSLKQFCENTTANAILRIYDRRAQRDAIALTVQTNIPETLPLDATEVGALLSNLLENAMVACAERLPAPAYICLTADMGEHGWQLEVRNSCCRKVSFDNGFPQSEKPLGGTGTKSIAAIVQRHHGILRFRQETDEFIAQIFLPM